MAGVSIDNTTDDAPDPRALKRTRGGRERLLTAAADLFRTHSLAGTSLQMIADRLGVSKPAIYHHFRSRDEIVVTLMEPALSDATAALERIHHLPQPDRSDAARSFYLGFLVTHRRVINMVFFDRPSLPAPLSATVDTLVDELAQVLSDPDVDTDAATAIVYGAAALVTRRSSLADDELREVLARTMASWAPATRT